MTAKQIRMIRYLNIATHFFIHRKQYKHCPIALEQLHELFGNNIKALLDKSGDTLSLEECKAMAKMIDETLDYTAEITLRSRKEHRKCLDRFKKRLWILLEVIDKYSKLFHNYEIWQENQS